MFFLFIQPFLSHKLMYLVQGHSWFVYKFVELAKLKIYRGSTGSLSHAIGHVLVTANHVRVNGILDIILVLYFLKPEAQIVLQTVVLSKLSSHPLLLHFLPQKVSGHKHFGNQKHIKEKQTMSSLIWYQICKNQRPIMDSSDQAIETLWFQQN